MEYLKIVILLCQVMGTHVGSGYSTTSYDDAKQNQKRCHKTLIECVDSKKNNFTEYKLKECIKEGNY